MLEKERSNGELVPEKKPESPVYQENENIRKVREIIFGKNMNELDRRFNRLEEIVDNEVNQTRGQAQAMYNSLEQYIKSELKNLSSLIDKKEEQRNTEFKAFLDNLKQVQESLNSFERSSSQQLRRDYENLTERNTELSDLLQQERKARLESAQVFENALNELRNQFGVQNSSISEMRQNIYRQVMEQAKLLEKKLGDEQSLREMREEETKGQIERINTSIIHFRNDHSKSLSEVQQQLRQHGSAIEQELPEAIRDSDKRHQDLSNMLRAELDDILRKFNSFTRKTDDDFKTIRESVHDNAKSLRLELEQQQRMLTGKLKSEQDVQRQQKLDRNTLALMFSELAMRLGDDSIEE